VPRAKLRPFNFRTSATRSSAHRPQMAQPAGNWSVKPLFGGAIACPVPSHLLDVTSVRHVPDNQEVRGHAQRGGDVELRARGQRA
jgi:hypothetical protein